MTGRAPRGDVRGFYAALGVELPGWAHTEAPVRCFADPTRTSTKTAMRRAR